MALRQSVEEAFTSIEKAILRAHTEQELVVQRLEREAGTSTQD